MPRLFLEVSQQNRKVVLKMLKIIYGHNFLRKSLVAGTGNHFGSRLKLYTIASSD